MTVNVLPASGRLATVTSPPLSNASFFTIDRPKPLPSMLRVFSLRMRANSVNSRCDFLLRHADARVGHFNDGRPLVSAHAHAHASAVVVVLDGVGEQVVVDDFDLASVSLDEQRLRGVEADRDFPFGGPGGDGLDR